MKGFLKSRILRTLNSFPNASHLASKQGSNKVFQIEAPNDEFFDASPTIAIQEAEFEDKENILGLLVNSIQVRNAELDDKENIKPKTPSKTPPFCHKSPEEAPPFEEEILERSDLGFGFSSYRRPDPNCSTLFDPDLLSAFKKAVSDHTNAFRQSRASATQPVNEESDLFAVFEPPNKIARTEPETDPSDPFDVFEAKCPPGGLNYVILYTTTLHSIRKTFEDCNRLRFLLDNLGINFHERDISMDLGYRDELWKVLGFRAIPPRLFIKGRYIGGSDEAIGLHENGRLRPLVRQFLIGREGRGSCEGCGGMKFMMCTGCSGSHRLYDREDDVTVQCLGCNENGLVPCPLCS